MYRKLFTAGASLAVVVGGLATAAPAMAAQSTQQIDCGGTTLTLRTADNHSSERGGWGAAQIVDGSGHLIPTSFTFSAYDDTTQTLLFEGASPKGSGHANNQQPTITCTQTMTDTLANLLEPGDEVPPGASLTDTVTATFTATVVVKQ